MKYARLVLLATALTFAALGFGWSAAPARAADYKIGAIEIGQPWSRATADGAPAGAGYLTITNTGTAPDRLVSATSPVATMTQIHEMSMDGSVMRMRELPKGLEIPPGKTVTLSPSQFHLMFMGLKGALKQGTRVPVSLTFEKAGKIDIELAVGSIGASSPGT